MISYIPLVLNSVLLGLTFQIPADLVWFVWGLVRLSALLTNLGNLYSNTGIKTAL